MNFSLILAASIVCAILYRMGGANPPYASWMRDWTIPPIVIAMTCGLVGFKLSYWWVYLLTYGLMGGMLSAYWGQDEKKYGFFWHGLGVAIAIIPISMVSGHWLSFILRLITLPLLMAWWSERETKVVREECGRGAAIGLTLLSYLI